jgi:hypothetical protein
VVSTPSESTPWRRFLDFVAAPPVADTAPKEPGRTPKVVVAAFFILLAIGVVQLASAVYALTTLSSDLHYAFTHPLKGYTPEQTRSIAKVVFIGNIIFVTMQAGLYTLFAFMVRQGRNWARVVLTVIVVVFGILLALSGSLGVVTELSLLVEVIAVAMLYSPTARDFFAAKKAAKRNPTS